MMILTPDLAQIFLIFGAILILFEVIMFTIGVLGVLGVGLAILGAIGIYTGQDINLLNPSEPLVWLAYITILSTTGLLIWLIIKAMRKPIETGREAMIGEIAEVTAWANKRGTVRIEGETWNARSNDTVAVGDNVTITALNKLTLTVKKGD